MKFLRARYVSFVVGMRALSAHIAPLYCRELKVKDAETMFVATLRWRDELKVDEIMKEEFPEKVFGGVGRVFGQDKEGNPVTYVTHASNPWRNADTQVNRYNIYGGGLDMKEVFGDVRRFIRSVYSHTTLARVSHSSGITGGACS